MTICSHSHVLDRKIGKQWVPWARYLPACFDPSMLWNLSNHCLWTYCGCAAATTRRLSGSDKQRHLNMKNERAALQDQRRHNHAIPTCLACEGFSRQNIARCRLSVVLAQTWLIAHGFTLAVTIPHRLNTHQAVLQQTRELAISKWNVAAVCCECIQDICQST
jgi:hypothetical protein